MQVPADQTLAHTTRTTRYTLEDDSEKIIHSDITDHALSADTNRPVNTTRHTRRYNMEMALIKNFLNQAIYLEMPKVFHASTYAKVRITCWGKYEQPPEKHYGRDEALATIQLWLNAGWNIWKISTCKHEQTETLKLHISMTKTPKPTEKCPNITTKTICYFHQHDKKLSTEDEIKLTMDSPIERGKITILLSKL